MSDNNWPDPTPEMLNGDPIFDAIWGVIKWWDINVPAVYSGYCGASGNHARAIRDAIGPALTPTEVDARVKETEAKIAAGCLISNAAEVADLVLLNPDRWRGAINDALTNWLSPIEDHETPKDALRRLIRLEVMAALDPKVSQAAADLVAQTRRDALEEAARVAKGFEGNDHLWSQHRWPLDDAWESASQAADIIAAAIRALKVETNE